MTNAAPNHLAAARRRDSQAKATRAHAAIQRLRTAGHRITTTRVAREAQVSTWFLYNTPEIRTAIALAVQDQLDNGCQVQSPGATPVSGHSLATDLALAREEIRALRADRDKLRKRLQLSLGADLDAITREELLERVATLEQEVTVLQGQRAAATSEAAKQAEIINQLTEELDGARLSLRRMMRVAPTGGVET